jgi:NifU-like protein involved in Fe-S cluster formation
MATNQKWLDSLSDFQIHIVANRWALKDAMTRDIASLKEELMRVADVQNYPQSREDMYTAKLLSYWDLSLMKTLTDYTHTFEYTSDICGDYIRMDAIIESGVFKTLEFSVSGCCISQCSAAMLVEYFRGRTVEEVLAFTQKDMLFLVGIKITRAREGCVLLGLQCLRKLCGQTKDTK